MDLDPRHIPLKILGNKTTFETGFRKGKREIEEVQTFFSPFQENNIKRKWSSYD